MRKIILLLFVIILQVFVLSKVRFVGITLNISLFIFIFISWNLDKKNLLKTAFLCGIVTDALVAGSFPKYIIVFMATALIIDYLHNKMGSNYNRWKLVVFIMSLVVLDLLTIIFGSIELTSTVFVIVCINILFNYMFAGIITMALPKKA
jgi:rod shape-determining protein MreD